MSSDKIIKSILFFLLNFMIKVLFDMGKKGIGKKHGSDLRQEEE